MKCLLLIHYRSELVYETAQRWQLRLFTNQPRAITIVPLTEKFQETRLWAHLSKTFPSDENIYGYLQLKFVISKNKGCSIINIFLYRKQDIFFVGSFSYGTLLAFVFLVKVLALFVHFVQFVLMSKN